MTGRSPSASDFRRHSTAATYDPGGGVNLHINPNRARTPRSNSIISQVALTSSDAEDDSPFTATKVIEETHSYTDSERTPLVRKGPSNFERQSFSNTVSEERAGPLATNIHDALSLCCAPPVEGKKKSQYLSWLKIFALFAITVLCSSVLAINTEHEEESHMTIVSANQSTTLTSGLCTSAAPNIRLKLYGPFSNNDTVRKTEATRILYRAVIQLGPNSTKELLVNKSALEYGERVELVEDFHCKKENDNTNLTVESEIQIPLTWYAHGLSSQLENEVVYAFLILGFVYILIIFELVHRTLAAMLGALAALSVLAALHERPTLDKIVEWIDMETLTLLFGMMIIVAIFSETGFFDYSALVAYKLAKGQIWRLITLLCVFSAVVSAFLDNVTTILLLAPVTIRLCEVLNLEPRKILMAEVLFSNIGGTATAIGDPPNVIIVGALNSQGITFSTFTMHVFPGIVFISFLGYGWLRLYYRNMNTLKNKDPPDIAEMKHEITMWNRAAKRCQNVTREETLMKALFLQKAVEIEHTMNKTLHRRQREEREDLQEMVKKLQNQYYIKDIPLLLKSGLVLLVVIVFLFTYSFVDTIHLDIGWIAVLGAIWLLVLADVEDIEGILHKVEWSTLLFFAALFILMEALAELGLIKTIGNGIADIITSVDESNRLLLAVIVILWVSAIASSFIDNIPYTTAMVPVLQDLSNNPDLNLELLPLVVSLALGACLGGNGTLIGASCNVVCAGIAEQHGYGFSFREFFKIGFPMMLVTTVGATIYVLICHVGIEWNSV